MASDDDRVRAQYEAYPYPARDPKDEKRRLVTGSPSHPLEIDHYLFAGARDWSKPFRALFAGGGTGDGTIMLAQGLADRSCPAEIVYLDVSTASRRIAEARALARGLGNIRFETGSLFDAARFGIFDYIDCCGVLHHLDDPASGLAALVAALAPEGGIGLMLYGELGRTGIYPVQRLLRTLAGDAPDRDRLALARRLLAALPESNWLKRNPLLSDHLASDAGLFDLLLHSRDRAFRVGEIEDLLAGAGLRVAAWIETLRYAPETYVTDPVLRRRLGEVPEAARAAIAEDLCGSMKNHVLYAVPRGRAETVARLDGEECVPVLREVDGAALAARMKPGERLVADLGGFRATFALPPLAPAILARIDGRAPLGEIRASLATAPSPEAFAADFAALYRVMNGLNRLLLRFPARSR
jgi:SAM-dependent methyltransferase